MLKTASKIKFADVESVKKRFLFINRERLRRAEECMRTNQRDFLDFLPLLFHVNHPQLPGYVTKDAPVGICDYNPTQRAIQAASRHIRRFEYKKKALRRYDITAMFLMGSSGTVAYSRKSDFDIWLCHQHDISVERLAELQAKCTAIEEWADEQGLEVHFFLMDPVNFKEGKIVDLSSESSGTAQYYLLLEEFYRTSLLLAGRFPIWWLVPVEEEANYDAYVQRLFKKRVVSDAECIDFGGLPTIPTEEFFGAALWQLFKGIDSPYKSVLKLSLMEVYASEYPDIELLCARFKKAIFEGENDLDRLDPYLMLYRRLEEYLLKNGEEDRLDLVRRCFYFKVNQKLSAPDPREFDWRRDVLRSMINSWEWEQPYLELMDTRASWKIKQVINERGGLVKELTHTYKFLSDFAREYSQLATINQSDMNALGRKLYAAFERKTGKIEIVNRGISQDVWESVLNFYQISQKGRDSGWALLAEGELDEHGEKGSMVPLKKARHVVEVIAWAYFNGLIDSTTTAKVSNFDGSLTSREIHALVNDLKKYMPASKVLTTDVESLGRPVQVMQSVIVVNMGNDPMVSNKHGGQHMASNHTDAFCYGGIGETLVKSFDQLIMTSWKEVISSNYVGTENILNCLANYFKLMPPSKGVAPPLPQVLCYAANHNLTIKQRIECFLKDVISCFYGGKDNLNNRFVFHVARIYYVVYLEGDSLQYQRLPSYAELLRYLGKGRQVFGRVVADRYAFSEALLPLIFKNNKPGVVQLFYKEEGKKADVYVMDENGSLFYQRIEFHDSARLLGHFGRFLDSVLQRQLFQLGGSGMDDAGSISVDFYHITRNQKGGYHFGREDIESFSKHGYFNVQVIAEKEGDDEASFKIYCDDQEFSSLEHDSDLFKSVASYVLEQRKGGQRYPIFITDIDLPPSMFNEYASGQVPTVDFLNYKKSIELKLNNALQGVGRAENVHTLKPRNS